MKFTKTTVIATAVAALFMAGSVSISAATHAKMVKCSGINSCKGQSACKGANNSCKAQNSCKGQGIKMVTAKQCKKKGGTIVQ